MPRTELTSGSDRCGYGNRRALSIIIPHIVVREALDRRPTSFASSFRRHRFTMPQRGRPRRSATCLRSAFLAWRAPMDGKRPTIVQLPRRMYGRPCRIATSRCRVLYVYCYGTTCLPAMPSGRRLHGKALLEQLQLLFAPYPPGAEADISKFCEFVAEQKADLADPEHRSTKQVQFDELTLRLGSIHSVKGKSADGILVVESEVWKGSGANERCIDPSTVLSVRSALLTGHLSAWGSPPRRTSSLV